MLVLSVFYQTLWIQGSLKLLPVSLTCLACDSSPKIIEYQGITVWAQAWFLTVHLTDFGPPRPAHHLWGQWWAQGVAWRVVCRHHRALAGGGGSPFFAAAQRPRATGTAPARARIRTRHTAERISVNCATRLWCWHAALRAYIRRIYSKRGF